MCDDNNTTETQLYLLFEGTICKTKAKHLKVGLQSKFRILDSIVSPDHILSRGWRRMEKHYTESNTVC